MLQRVHAELPDPAVVARWRARNEAARVRDPMEMERNAWRQRNINDPGWRNRERARQANDNQVRLQHRRAELAELNRVWGPEQERWARPGPWGLGPRDPVGEPVATLNISLAPHINELRLNLKKEFPNGNSLSYEEFVNGDELVRLQGNNKYVFKINDLQTFFNTGRNINPLTGLPITQNDIERFTYVEDPTLGGRRNRRNRKTKRKMNKRKTNRRYK